MTTLAGPMGEKHERIGRLALGTVQFGLAYGVANKHGKVSRAEAKKMLEMASVQGLNTIDTAIGYGDSEDSLGQIGVSAFKLVTKLPALPSGTTDVKHWVFEQTRSSIARLGVSRLHGLLLHKPLELLGENGAALYGALCELKESSLVQKIGASIYSPNELQALMDKYRLDLIQAPFNILDRRLHSSGWLQRLKDREIEIHTRSAFLQGLLLMSREAIPAKFSRWDILWDNWHQWLLDHNETALHACLNFTLSFPEIDHVLIGADSVDQLQQILCEVTREAPSPLPDFFCDDECLINPAHWSAL